jgi:hypothetical protein
MLLGWWKSNVHPVSGWSLSTAPLMQLRSTEREQVSGCKQRAYRMYTLGKIPGHSKLWQVYQYCATPGGTPALAITQVK